MSVFRGIREPDRRVTVVTGHYGSGKTEFSVSLAMLLAKHGSGPASVKRCSLRRAYPSTAAPTSTT